MDICVDRLVEGDKRRDGQMDVDRWVDRQMDM